MKSVTPGSFMSRRSISRTLLALCAASFAALAGGRAYACQPCESTLDLRRSLERADLVVLAKRAKPSKEPDGPGGGAACDELTVERVLKGEFEGESLTVRRWYGMCPYGVILGEGTYVVVLRKAATAEHEQATYNDEECREALKRKPELYTPVEHGCAVKALRVESGSVEAEGVKMTLEEFRERYGLASKEARRPSARPFEAWGARGHAWERLTGPAFRPGLFEVTN